MTAPTIDFEAFLPFSTIFIPAAGLKDFVAADGQPYGTQTNRVPMQDCMNTITAVWNGAFPIVLSIRDSRAGFWKPALKLPEVARGGEFSRGTILYAALNGEEMAITPNRLVTEAEAAAGFRCGIAVIPTGARTTA